MVDHLHHIKWPPLNVTIFIRHVPNLRNGCYANVVNLYAFLSSTDFLKIIELFKEYQSDKQC